MGRQFENHHDAEVPASPEQVWEAIATGPGVSSWFVGRTEIDGDTVRTAFGDGFMPAGRVTAAEEPHRFAYRSDTAEDGRFVAYEYLIEGRHRAGTVLRTVTSGFLPGDDWADEFEAMGFGTELFFHTLTEYLRFFPGRMATPVTAFGPPVTDWPLTWEKLEAALPWADGVVFFRNPHSLAIRTPDALYRFIRGFHGAMVADHALFSPDDNATPRWQNFLKGISR
jgi:uncharacterized protein YndB with AHSA1/START domain